MRIVKHKFCVAWFQLLEYGTLELQEEAAPGSLNQGNQAQKFTSTSFTRPIYGSLEKEKEVK